MACVKWEYVNMDESPQPEFLLIHQVLMKLHHCKNWLWTETVHYSTKAVFIPPSYGQCADTTLSGLLLAETVGSAQGGDEYSFLYSLTTAAVTKLLSLHKLPSHLRTWSIFQTLVLTWSLWDFILPALGACITFLLQYDVFFFTTALLLQGQQLDWYHIWSNTAEEEVSHATDMCTRHWAIFLKYT